MTHVYAYVKEIVEKEQLHSLIGAIKSAVTEGFNMEDSASTVAVKELAADSYSEGFGAFVLVYTAKGKGIDIKKRFAKLLDKGMRRVIGEDQEVRLVIKEQANDMTGVNGVLRCNKKDLNTQYELG